MDEQDKEALAEDNEGMDDAPSEEEVDAVTGASPGTAQACSDLGLNSLEQNLLKFNIKPPGIS